MLSIPSYKSEDPNYRYKMPRLQAKVEGRGNGIRTNIMNMGEIAKCLKRPPEYTTRFCGHELGASSKFEANEGKAIVNGAHEQRDLQAVIDKFIDKFVLCQKCSLPEIDLLLRKGRVGYSCNACGDQGEVDNAHKLATFILRNPPECADSTCASTSLNGKKMSREDRQRIKADKASRKQDDDAKKSSTRSKAKSTTKEPAEDEVDEETKSKKKKSSSTLRKSGLEDAPAATEGGEEKRSKSKKSKKSKKPEDDDALTYDSPEIDVMVKAMAEFLHEKAVPLGADDDILVDDPVLAAATTDGEATSSKAVDGCSQLPVGSIGDAFNRELNLLRITNGASQRVALFVGLQTLYGATAPQQAETAAAFTPESFAERTELLAAVAKNMLPEDILEVFEEFICRKAAIKDYPYLLQKLFDADIIDEEDILKRYAGTKSVGGNAAVVAQAKAAAEPFVRWLQADDSSGDASLNDE